MTVIHDWGMFDPEDGIDGPGGVDHPNRRAERPAVWDLVADDMVSRDALGFRRYGERLKPHNGRDGLRDLYEELLDAVAYIRQVIYERDGR